MTDFCLICGGTASQKTIMAKIYPGPSIISGELNPKEIKENLLPGQTTTQVVADGLICFIDAMKTGDRLFIEAGGQLSSAIIKRALGRDTLCLTINPIELINRSAKEEPSPEQRFNVLTDLALVQDFSSFNQFQASGLADLEVNMAGSTLRFRQDLQEVRKAFDNRAHALEVSLLIGATTAREKTQVGKFIAGLKDYVKETIALEASLSRRAAKAIENTAYWLVFNPDDNSPRPKFPGMGDTIITGLIAALTPISRFPNISKFRQFTRTGTDAGLRQRRKKQENSGDKKGLSYRPEIYQILWNWTEISHFWIKPSVWQDLMKARTIVFKAAHPEEQNSSPSHKYAHLRQMARIWMLAQLMEYIYFAFRFIQERADKGLTTTAKDLDEWYLKSKWQDFFIRHRTPLNDNWGIVSDFFLNHQNEKFVENIILHEAVIKDVWARVKK